MKGQRLLYVDQYGQKFYASTLKELKAQIPGKVSKMYWDSNFTKGPVKTYHVGYVIGKHWLNAYQQVWKECK